MTELIWFCPRCGSSDERMEAVKGRRVWLIFGPRKRKLIAVCLDCWWPDMELVGTV